MASASQTAPEKGDHAPPSATAVRCPCPVLNTLANHGYLNRSGRNITESEVRDGLNHLGLGPDLIAYLIDATFKIHSATPIPGQSVSMKGVRDVEDVNEQGEKVIHMDKVGRPDALEHDVSVTREDRKLGDPIHASPALVQQALAASTDGKTVTRDDLIALRKLRYQQQKEKNAELHFDAETNTTCAGELSLIQGVFGQGWGWSVPVAYLRALLQDERLPIVEGWRPRRIWLTFLEAFYLRSRLDWPSSPFTSKAKGFLHIHGLSE